MPPQLCLTHRAVRPSLARDSNVSLNAKNHVRRADPLPKAFSACTACADGFTTRRASQFSRVRARRSLAENLFHWRKRDLLLAPLCATSTRTRSPPALSYRHGGPRLRCACLPRTSRIRNISLNTVTRQQRSPPASCATTTRAPLYTCGCVAKEGTRRSVRVGYMLRANQIVGRKRRIAFIASCRRHPRVLHSILPQHSHRRAAPPSTPVLRAPRALATATTTPPGTCTAPHATPHLPPHLPHTLPHLHTPPTATTHLAAQHHRCARVS